MSGFAPEWLALREGMDHRAVNHAVRRELLGYLGGKATVCITDLGCGTGSNFRSLAPDIAAGQRWLLVDYDAKLLRLAATMTAELAEARGITVETLETDLAASDFAEIAGGCDLITAAALFDLVSPAVIDRMADAISTAGCAFYTVLTYDGIATWLPETSHNATLRAAFNHHQRTDKGFGPAAGPTATDVLARAFTAHGYSVFRGRSPWVLDAAFATLRRETDRGWVGAVVETGALARAEADAWLAAREGDAAAVTIVGHEDLLALPPR
jgi:SAM-dependent methyltransferase